MKRAWELRRRLFRLLYIYIKSFKGKIHKCFTFLQQRYKIFFFTWREISNYNEKKSLQWLSGILTFWDLQKQASRRGPRKRCSENLHQIYRRTLMPKCDFNKVAKQLYWNHTSASVFSCKFAAYFQSTFT